MNFLIAMQKKKKEILHGKFQFLCRQSLVFQSNNGDEKFNHLLKCREKNGPTH